MDDFEYEIITDENVEGFFTGGDGRESDFLSEEIAEQAAVAREGELREINRLRRMLANRRRGGNIARATYRRGIAILNAQQDALERVDQPAAVTLPETLDPYGSPMMVTIQPPPTPTRTPSDTLSSGKRKPPSGNPNGNPRRTPRKDARAAGRRFYISGKACPAGHTSKRRVSSGGCVACGDAWTDANRVAARRHWRESKQRARDRAQTTAV